MSNWISVTERLPEYGVDVLLYLDNYTYKAQVGSHDTVIGFRASTDAKGDLFRSGIHQIRTEYSVFGCGKVVTHWQPLPEPPKEGEG